MLVTTLAQKYKAPTPQGELGALAEPAGRTTRALLKITPSASALPQGEGLKSVHFLCLKVISLLDHLSQSSLFNTI